MPNEHPTPIQAVPETPPPPPKSSQHSPPSAQPPFQQPPPKPSEPSDRAPQPKPSTESQSQQELPAKQPPSAPPPQKQPPQAPPPQAPPAPQEQHQHIASNGSSPTGAPTAPTKAPGKSPTETEDKSKAKVREASPRTLPPTPHEPAPAPPAAAPPVAKPPPASAPPPPEPKVDGEQSAFAKFFKRAGLPTEPLPQTEAEKDAEREKAEKERKALEEKEKEKQREKEKELEKAKANEREKENAKEKANDKKQESSPKGPIPSEDPPLPSSKERKTTDEHPAPAQWPARRPAAPPAVEKREPSSSPKLEAQEPPKDEESAKSSPKLSISLPPPGTVTKKEETAAAVAPVAPVTQVAPEDDDDPEQQFVAGELDQKYVGLVIGKAGETIKTFKKQSGASIEIDQNLPDGMPRVVIYRGTKKQVALAKKLVENLVQRAKEDEKGKTATAPIGTGMGIMGRGESKDGKEVPDRARTMPSPTQTAAEDPTKGADLPPWRRLPKAEDEQQQPAQQRPPTEPVRRQPPNRRDAPWMKNQKEAEAAPSGSLTGGLLGSLTGGLTSSLRPAWMKPNKGAEEEEKTNPGIDRSVWQEQRYGRSLMLTAKQKTLKMKAYEVPAEMMTMTTGPRPKYKSEKKEKDALDDKEESSTLATARGSDDPAFSPPVGARSPPLEDDPPPVTLTAASNNDVEISEEVSSKKKDKKNGDKTPIEAKESNGLYENLPGDSKDIMKLKKKLREIQKIEDQLASGEKLEPNKVEKVTKKAGYLEELKVLESIVHSSGVTNGA